MDDYMIIPYLWSVIRTEQLIGSGCSVTAPEKLKNQKSPRSTLLWRSDLQQSVGHVTVLPAQTGGLGMLVQVRRLAETLPTGETGVGFLSCVDADVLLAVSQREEGFAADFTGVLPVSFDHQDVVLRQSLLALGQDVS